MKYVYTYQTKTPTKFVKNERAAEATRRPTAQQLQSEDIVSAMLVLVMCGGFAAMLALELVAVTLGWLA